MIILKNKIKKVRFTGKKEDLIKLTTLLQSGIYIKAAQGITIAKLLMELPGFSEEYIKTRVQAIFLNGLPVDGINTPIIKENSVLAISAAMPGLAGAIFKKDSSLASARTTPASSSTLPNKKNKLITIRLKMFNLIAREKGLQSMAKGCIIATEALFNLLDYRPSIISGVKEVFIDNKAIEKTKIRKHLLPEGRIEIKTT